MNDPNDPPKKPDDLTLKGANEQPEEVVYYIIAGERYRAWPVILGDSLLQSTDDAPRPS